MEFSACWFEHVQCGVKGGVRNLSFAVAASGSNERPGLDIKFPLDSRIFSSRKFTKNHVSMAT